MKKFRYKAAVAALTLAVAAGMCVPLSACDSGLDWGQFAETDFLTVEGSLVKNGNDETVQLRGVNAGGLLVTEHWMTGFLYGKTPSNDYRSLTQTFIQRFGEKKTKKLWTEYRANWWTENDFKYCAEMGFNVIRLPFTYMNLDFAAVTDYANAGKQYDFTVLDDFVETAAKYGMYTILDMHGAYGSQNGQDHSGQIIGTAEEVDFYTNERMISLTCDLWKAIAERYQDHPAVAGYDILNEPGEKAGTTSKRHWDIYDRIYKSIRSVDKRHIVIFESCWDGKNLPHPSEYGWKNCMYSFHHYAGDKIDVNTHMASWQNKMTDIESRNFGVPLQMGEFTCYTNAEKWEKTLTLLNDHNWHWASWTYKIWGNNAWGVMNIRGSNDDKVNAAEDTYETILKKFKILLTDGSYTQNYTFTKKNESGENEVYKTLEEIYKESFLSAQSAKA